MKTFSLIVMMILLSCSGTLPAQDIEARLPGSSGSNGFTVYDSNQTGLFTVRGNNRVGIGTTGPTRPLHVKGSTPTDAAIFIEPSVWNSAGHYSTLYLSDHLNYIRGEFGTGMLFGSGTDDFRFDGRVIVDQDLYWGGNLLATDQTGAIKLGNSNANGTTPYFDFRYGIGSNQSYNFRIINAGNKVLAFSDAINGTVLLLDNASVALGKNTTASGTYSTAMGSSTTASGNRSTATGNLTAASGNYSTAMGSSTTASGNFSTAMGGSTVASGIYSTSMGYHAEASGDYSTAIGYYVKTTGKGSFVIGDQSTSSLSTFVSDNEFYARFVNGYHLYTNSGCYISAWLPGNSNSWVSSSDSSKKEEYLPADGEHFLERFRTLRLGTWNYIGQEPANYRHYGPMAQEWFAAFGKDRYGVIGNDTSLASADVDGVLCIAVQALEKRTAENQTILAATQLQLKAKDEEIARLRKEMALLQQGNARRDAQYHDLVRLVHDHQKQQQEPDQHHVQLIHPEVGQ